MPHGFDDGLWNQAKNEALNLLIERAKDKKPNEQCISYTGFVNSLVNINLEAHDPRLSKFLEEILRSEHAKGNPLITLLVVHKQGDKKPGGGFFEICDELGFDTSDRDSFWIKQHKRVIDYYKNNQ